MDKRDLEDAVMQAREETREVLDESNREMNEPAMKRALGEFWHALPPELKAQIALDKPEIVKEMDKMFGKTQVQGNPWGTLPAPETNSPFANKKGR